MNRIVPTLITFAAMTLTPAVAQAQDSFGAIAYSSQTTAYGITADRSSPGAAEQRAIFLCELESQSGDCRSLLVFKNACGAVAANQDGSVGTGWGVNPSLAGGYAIESCESNFGKACVVLDTVCTP